MRNNTPALDLGLNVIIEEIKKHVFSAYGAVAADRTELLPDIRAVEMRLASIDAIFANWDKLNGIDKCHTLIDKHIAKLASGMNLDIFELIDAGELLVFSQELRKIFSATAFVGTEIGELSLNIADYEGFCKKLAGIINPDGTIASTASDKLYQIRQEKQRLTRQMTALFNKYLQNRDYEEYFVEKSPVIRENRLTLAIKVSYKKAIKGMLVDISDSGDTVYIEPFDVVEANNNIRELEIAEKVEIDNILRDISILLRANLDEIRAITLAVADIDRLLAIASYCRSKDMTRPLFGDSITLYDLKNPLLENPFPITFKWDEGSRVLIISGANTSGKTALIKSVGLTCLMGSMGMFIPAGFDSRIIFISDIFVDIGDGQDINEGLSSFSGHVRNLNHIVENVGANSLVLLDEIGSSTDPQEGAALAIAYIEEISKKGRVIATTHLLPLKTYAIENFKTGAMYHREGEYIYTKDSVSASNAINIAREFGTKPEILSRATGLIDEKYVDIENVYKYLEQEKFKLNQQNEKLNKIIRENEAVQGKLNIELNNIKTSKQKIAAEYKEKLQNDIEIIKTNLKNKIGSKLNAKEYAQVVTELSHDMAKIDGELKPQQQLKVQEKPIYQPNEEKAKLVVGSKCYYHAMEKEGVIQSIKGDKAVVMFGIVKMTLSLSELAPSIEDSEAKQEKTKFRKEFVKVTHNLSGVGLSLDIRGYRALDGVDAVMQYLDRVSQAGYGEVTILHGKGTGQLKKAIWDYLKTSPYVKKYREGKIGEGDSGVTVVEVR